MGLLKNPGEVENMTLKLQNGIWTVTNVVISTSHEMGILWGN